MNISDFGFKLSGDPLPAGAEVFVIFANIGIAQADPKTGEIPKLDHIAKLFFPYAKLRIRWGNMMIDGVGKGEQIVSFNPNQNDLNLNLPNRIEREGLGNLVITEA